MLGSRRHTALAAVLLCASIAGSVLTLHAGSAAAQKQSAARAESAANQVEDRLEQAITQLDDLRRFFVLHRDVTAPQYTDEVNDMLASSGLPGAAWIQRVEDRDRPAYQRSLGAPITDIDPNFDIAVISPPRDVYYPATFLVWPRVTARHGLDFGTRPELVAALQSPATNFGVAASARATALNGRLGVYLIELAPRFVASAIDPGYITTFVPQDWLEDVRTASGGRIEIRIGDAAPPIPHGFASTSFTDANRRWEVGVRAVSIDPAARALGWSIGAGGLALAVLIFLLGVGAAARARVREGFDRMFLLSRDLVCIANYRGYFTRLNPAFTKVLGYTEEELLSRPFIDFVHEDDRDSTQAATEQLAAAVEVRGLVNRYHCADGSVRWLEWNAVGVADRKEIYATARDITERKAAEAERQRLETELRQSQKLEAMGRLAGGVAHDFNNVLTVISGYSDLALQAIQAGSDSRADVEEVRRAAEQARSMTRHLLLFSRGGLPETATTDPNEAVSEMTRMLARLIGTDIELLTNLGVGVGLVGFDRGQFEQLLVNLVLNARDAMPDGGALTIRTASASLDADAAGEMSVRPGDFAAITIQDNGTGMDAETRARAFEPFFTTKEVGRGTGLGLSTAWGMVEHAGGHIVLDSEAGVGTKLTIYLPKAPAEAAVGEVGKNEAVDQPEACLVVDDDNLVRSLTVRILRAAGHEVIDAPDATAALQLWQHHRGHLTAIVTDVVMPGVSGVDFAAQVLSDNPAVAVVVMSGYAGDAVADELRAGGAAFLEKPFVRESLLAALHAARESARRRAVTASRT